MADLCVVEFRVCVDQREKRASRLMFKKIQYGLVIQVVSRFKSYGDFGEVGRHVWDVTLGVVMFFGGVKDSVISFLKFYWTVRI